MGQVCVSREEHETSLKEVSVPSMPHAEAEDCTAPFNTARPKQSREDTQSLSSQLNAMERRALEAEKRQKELEKTVLTQQPSVDAMEQRAIEAEKRQRDLEKAALTQQHSVDAMERRAIEAEKRQGELDFAALALKLSVEAMERRAVEAEKRQGELEKAALTQQDSVVAFATPAQNYFSKLSKAIGKWEDRLTAAETAWSPWGDIRKMKGELEGMQHEADALGNRSELILATVSGTGNIASENEAILDDNKLHQIADATTSAQIKV